MQLFKVIQDVLNDPPMKFEPEKHTMKAWAMYCLRARGFRVVYAQNADFAVQPRSGEKIYFKVTKSGVDLDPTFGWIVLDETNSVTAIAPQAN